MRRYLHPRILAILLLGISSGLPRALVGGTLSAWLAKSGAPKEVISDLLGLTASFYSFKFVWSPLMDQLRLPLLTRWAGQRVGWMLLTQGVLIGGLVALAWHDPALSFGEFSLLAALVALASASQDVVIDAYRAEYLARDQYGEGAAVAVFGYRVGMLVSGAGALVLAGWLGADGAYDASVWRVIYLVMAGIMALGMVTALLAGEPDVAREEKAGRSLRQWVRDAVIAPFQQFAEAHPRWVLLLLFVLFYRVADAFIGSMANPFYLEMGYTLAQVGSIAKLYGFAAVLLGGILGAAALHRLGMYGALWWFGLAQLLSNLIYILLLHTGPAPWALMVVISVENLASGAVGAVAVAFLTQLCDTRYTATQYALLSSLAALTGAQLSRYAGYVVDQAGWEAMFALSAILGLPALALLVPLRKHPVLAGKK
jgi:PAT family beta-lactamase induction signal transducer AmpG